MALLNARAAVVSDIYSLKQKQGVPRFNRARTEAILERLVEANRGPLTAQEVRDLFGPLLDSSSSDFAPAAMSPAREVEPPWLRT